VDRDTHAPRPGATSPDAADNPVRRIGVWLLGAGGILVAVGLIADAARHSSDADLAAEEGIFDLSGVPHALFFGGICAAVLGVLAIAFGGVLYRRDGRVTVGRRLAQVVAPIAAIALVAGCATVAGNSSLSRPSDAPADEASGHTHDESSADDGSADGASAHDDTDSHAHSDATEAVVPPKPYDPSLPIDLGGVEGVTPQQQAEAENLLAVTLVRLPHFGDPAVAEAAGYASIGDALTGHEHYVNTALFDDGRILDPDYPESLVYVPDRNAPGGKRLAAAMFMLGSQDTLEDVPPLGGKLMQWHIHNNLCFTASGRVAGVTSADGPCRPPLVRGPQSPMIHVWIEPHQCGPFAALEGIGGGQIAEGEERLCDHAHGTPGTGT
jgi:hypothetical protein